MRRWGLVTRWGVAPGGGRLRIEILVILVSSLLTVCVAVRWPTVWSPKVEGKPWTSWR
jgi:hypothetical protein